MFGAGWTEMLIIGVVALVVIGPKDLPVVMRRVGRMVGTVRRMGSEFQRELNKTTGLDQISDLRRSITEPLRQTSEEIAREFNRQTATGVEPTGILQPTDPKVESVYDQIAATSGIAVGSDTPVTVAPPPVMKPMATAPEPSPAPAEASAPVVADSAKPKPKRVARAKTTAVAAPSEPAPAATAPVRRRASKPAPPVVAETETPKRPRSRKAVAAPSEVAEAKPAARPRAKAAAATTVPASVAEPAAAEAVAAATKPARSRTKKA